MPEVDEVKLGARREDGVFIRAKDIKLGPALNLDGLIAGWLAEVSYRPVPARPGRPRVGKGLAEIGHRPPSRDARDRAGAAADAAKPDR